MAGPGEAGELLDVAAEKLAGLVALVAVDGLCRLQAAPTVMPGRRRVRLAIAGTMPVPAAIRLPVQRWRRSARI
ncbi:hypothetical protein SH611_17590 [Geminicoccaceae bacterium 1502E]|nr:hypothetical protein [Geminicoccaceae bacterium 1502E]